MKTRRTLLLRTRILRHGTHTERKRTNDGRETAHGWKRSENHMCEDILKSTRRDSFRSNSPTIVTPTRNSPLINR